MFNQQFDLIIWCHDVRILPTPSVKKNGISQKKWLERYFVPAFLLIHVPSWHTEG